MAHREIRDYYFSSVFTKEWCQKISDKFKLLLDEEARIEVRDRLSWIASQYYPLKHGNTGKSSYHDDREKLASTQKSLENSKYALLEIFNRFQCQMRFHAANRDTEQLFYLKMAEENGKSESTDFQNIVRFIGRLADICGTAAKKEYDPPSKLSSIALDISFENLIPLWQRHFSPVPYTEGKHYDDGVGYNSPAVYLSMEIFSKIDPDTKWLNSTLAGVIKRTKNLYKRNG